MYALLNDFKLLFAFASCVPIGVVKVEPFPGIVREPPLVHLFEVRVRRVLTDDGRRRPATDRALGGPPSDQPRPVNLAGQPVLHAVHRRRHVIPETKRKVDVPWIPPKLPDAVLDGGQVRPPVVQAPLPRRSVSILSAFGLTLGYNLCDFLN